MKKEETGKWAYDYRIASDHFYSPLKYGDNRLYQVGRIICNAHTVIPTHTQRNYIEFTVAVEGKGEIITNGERVAIAAGDIYLSFPGDFHAIESDKNEPLTFDFLTVQTDNEDLRRSFEKIISTRQGADLRTVRCERIRRLVAQAINEVKSPDTFSDLALRAILDQILVCTVREFASCEAEDKTNEARDRKLICLKLMNYIDNHIYTIKSLHDLEGVLNYSYNYMSNVFKAETGGTLREYLCERRFEAARLLLRGGQFSVTRIAEMLGYSSVYSFSLAFKRRFGYPPAEEKEKQKSAAQNDLQ